MIRTVQVYDGDGEKHLPGMMAYTPSTVAEAVALLTTLVKPSERDAIKQQPRDKLIMLHHSFGQWIRNNFGLWTTNKALLEDARPMIPPPEAKYLPILGPDYGKEPHPDDVSTVIIEKFWESLQ